MPGKRPSTTNLLIAAALLLVAESYPVLPVQAQRIEIPPPQVRIDDSGTLTPKAREAANLLGILPKVERLIQIKAAKQNNRDASLSDEELGLKVDVLDRVMGASLEVRMVAGRIDRELAWAYSGQGMLQAKRQNRLNMIFTANFMQIGILGTLSGPAFLNHKPIIGTELLLLASSIGLLFSTLSLIESRSGTKKVDGGTTILADVFHIDANDKPDHRIEIVTNYLNSVPPGAADGKTRIENLVNNWKKGKYLRNMRLDTLQKLAAVNPEGKHFKENIGLLNSRIRMLFDTQYTIELLHEELVELLRATQAA